MLKLKHFFSCYGKPIGSFIGTISSLVSLIVVIFTIFDKNYQMNIYRETEINPIEIKRFVKDLELHAYYKNQSINLNKKQLKIITVTFRNSGNQGIKPEDYVDEEKLGLEFADEIELLVVEVLEGKDDLLKESFLPMKDRQKETNSNYYVNKFDFQNIICFNKITFSPGDYITLQVVLLHPVHIKEIYFKALGKIHQCGHLEINDQRTIGNYYKSLIEKKYIKIIIFTFLFFLFGVLSVFIWRSHKKSVNKYSERKVEDDIRESTDDLIDQYTKNN